jgi:hypothetical protein
VESSPSRVGRRLAPAGVLLFGVLAGAGTVSREWPQLQRPSLWAAIFSGPGDFPPGAVLSALFHGHSVAGVYASPLAPYPLPYLLAFAPLELIRDPWIRPAITIICLGLLAFSVLLLAGRTDRALIPALVSVPVLQQILSPHLPAEVGLAGVCLAAWSQPRQRWVVMGVGLAMALERPPNALPLLAVLVWCSWGQWRGLLKAALTGAAVMAAPVLVAFWIDPGWLAVYTANLHYTMYAGLPLLALDMGGTWGLVGLQLATVAVALFLVRDLRGRPLDADLAAFVISLGVLSSKLSGPYSGIYALPALVRVGLRPQLAWTPWLASGVGWIMELTFLPAMLAGAAAPPAWESVVAYWFVLAAWPLALVRRLGPPRDGADARPAPLLRSGHAVAASSAGSKFSSSS